MRCATSRVSRSISAHSALLRARLCRRPPVRLGRDSNLWGDRQTAQRATRIRAYLWSDNGGQSGAADHPCHRVTAANGRIGGFSAPGGSMSKAHMLRLEGVEVRDGIVTRDTPSGGWASRTGTYLPENQRLSRTRTIADLTEATNSQAQHVPWRRRCYVSELGA